MSLTIDVNKLKFTIFASGHDYTLADSGDGEVQVFSHPFVPLNSVNYAGQWFFLVPDENGDPMDCVKDDLAHCTFTPALGATFNTEGEVTVECHYHREYIYPEETLVVDKTVTQKITVVDHGTVSSSQTYGDIYTDGYLFLRPRYMNSVETDIRYLLFDTPTKVSSFPWRGKALYTTVSPAYNAQSLTDITEWEYGDTSEMVEISGILYNSPDLDLKPVSEWDISNVVTLNAVFQLSRISSFKPLAMWNLSSVEFLNRIFNYSKASTLEGVEKWNVKKVKDLNSAFAGMENLTSLEPLSEWEFENLEDMGYTFNDLKVLSLHGVENWNVSTVTNLIYAVANNPNLTDLLPLALWDCKPVYMNGFAYNVPNLHDYKGLENIDFSECTTLASAFSYDTYVTSLEGLEDKDTSKVTDFSSCFAGNYWLGDISAIDGWSFESATTVNQMFYNNAVLDTIDVTFDLSGVVTTAGMFNSGNLYYSPTISKTVREDMYWYYDYEGNRYAKTGIVVGSPYPKDASGANAWTVSGTGLNIFSDAWSNRPAWN